MTASTGKILRELLIAKRGTLVPGAFNALSARVIADLGFEAIYVTGAGVTNMHLGLPDMGFMGLAEIAEQTARIRDAAEVPLIVDADTGCGNALNVRHPISGHWCRAHSMHCRRALLPISASRRSTSPAPVSPICIWAFPTWASWAWLKSPNRPRAFAMRSKCR